MSLLQIINHGPLITSSNFWESDLAAAGKLFVSVNAGAIRILLPPARYPCLIDMRTSQYCVLSRGPWPAEGLPEAVEILWEDGSEAPFCLHLSPESFDMLPGQPETGREWVCSTWCLKDGRPHLALQRICHWRRVPKLPWLKPWG